MDYVLDRDGRRVYPGDYVRCVVTHYDSIERGGRRRVNRVDESGNVVLANISAPRGFSSYNPRNFVIHARYQKPHMYEQQPEKNMLHIAVQIGSDVVMATFEDVATEINSNTIAQKMMADTSQSALKERIKARLAAYPDEKWLILSGNTIGERAEPPVRFRSV